MTRLATVVRFAFALAIVAGVMSVALDSPAEARLRKGKITIHKLTCPENTGDVFGKCHDDRLDGIRFTIKGKKVIVTDDDGVASVVVIPGTATIAENASDFATYASAGRALVYCSDQRSGKVVYNAYTTTGAVSFNVWDGADIVCDIYNLTTTRVS